MENLQNIEWIQRALDPSTPMLDNQTVRTEYSEVDGKIILYPTIRMIDGKLVNLKEKGIDPFEYAFQKGDFLSFDTPEEAQQFSKMFSDLIGNTRNTNKRIEGNAKDIF